MDADFLEHLMQRTISKEHKNETDPVDMARVLNTEARFAATWYILRKIKEALILMRKKGIHQRERKS